MQSKKKKIIKIKEEINEIFKKEIKENQWNQKLSYSWPIDIGKDVQH